VSGLSLNILVPTISKPFTFASERNGRNKITIVEKYCFSGLTNLTDLDISFNKSNQFVIA
jgi:hypothetical protein